MSVVPLPSKHKFALNSTKQRRLVLLLSVVIGILSGLAAVLLKNAVHFTNELITSGFDFSEGNYSDWYWAYCIIRLFYYQR